VHFDDLVHHLRFCDAVIGFSAMMIIPCHDKGDGVMDRMQAGFIVTAVTSTIVLIASIVWLAVLL
jgi:hypothetical protein